MNPREFPPTVFQSFENRSDPAHVAPRLRALRRELEHARLDAFLIPRADAHRGEAVPASEARLQYVTGFTGSAGIALVGKTKAGLFVDSRYTLQAPLETDTKLVTVVQTIQGQAASQLADFAPKGKIGYDPWLHTPGEITELGDKLKGKATLVPSDNLVDRIWTDRPAPPVTPIEFLGHNRAGKLSKDKLVDLKKVLKDEGADAVVLTLPESICWLFNMRGRDVPNTPVVLGFAIVPRTGKPTLFLRKGKIGKEVRAGLKEVAKLADAATFIGALRKLGAGDKHVMLDPATAPVAVVNAVKGVSDSRIIEKRDPVLLPKSKKNDAEIGGMREAHRLDGIAMAKFLRWLDEAAPGGKLTEIGITTALEAFRREEPSLVDLSFDTIAGAGPNGAINHYHVNRKSDRRLKAGELMLVDSGGQYLTGTTDITRTIATGKPTPEQIDRFTRVLKGMIAVSRARFPRGTSGAQIDILARQFLWQAGVTYEHGTGHGVGAFLSVHEGPTGISPRYTLPLEPGMIISNEPGFYKDGAYGIRTENLVLVRESTLGAGRFLEFETLTLAPIDLRLIDPGMLTAQERDWLDRYHERVWNEIGPALKGEDKAWLKQATRAL